MLVRAAKPRLAVKLVYQPRPPPMNNTILSLDRDFSHFGLFET